MLFARLNWFYILGDLLAKFKTIQVLVIVQHTYLDLPQCCLIFSNFLYKVLAGGS